MKVPLLLIFTALLAMATTGGVPNALHQCFRELKRSEILPHDDDMIVGDLEQHFNTLYPKRSINTTVTGDDNVKRDVTMSLEITLTTNGKVNITANITNDGTVDIDILNVENLFDNRPVWKVDLFETNKETLNNKRAEYVGGSADSRTSRLLKLFVSCHLLTLQNRPALTRKCHHHQWDISSVAASHGDHGYYKAIVQDTYLVKPRGKGLDEQKNLDVLSNTLSMRISSADAMEAIAAINDRLPPKTDIEIVDFGCNDAQKELIKDALEWTFEMCTTGITEAIVFGHSINSKFFAYYHSTLMPDRCLVARNLYAIAGYTTVVRSSTIKLTCFDPTPRCRVNMFTWAESGGSNIILCPPFLQMENFTETCHVRDMALTLINRFGRTRGIIDPPLRSFRNGQGWPACTTIRRDRALGNADTYGFFGQSSRLHCGRPY